MNTLESDILIPQDQAHRDVAASALDQNVLVLAGAGTGKTRSLIDRLILLLLGKEIPVERIVALTFTKKAAEEMRVRLEERLRDIAADPNSMPLLSQLYAANKEKWPGLIEDALEAIPKAQIGTIHSFAGFLLRLYPVQAGVDPKFREDEGEVFEQLFEDSWRAWLTTELQEKSPRAKLWKEVLIKVPIDDLKTLAKDCVSPLVEWNQLSKTTDIKHLINESLEKIEALRSSHPISPQAKKFQSGITALQEILETLKAKKPLPLAALLTLRQTKFDKPPKGWEEEREALSLLRRRTLALAEVDEALIQKALDVVKPLVTQVRQELNRQGVVSFDGLLVYARNLLRDHPEVRKDVKKRFATFLVDEFQDTDPLQGEILFYLAESAGSLASDWREVSLEPGRLFVVGDPKQSIYRFRGADMAGFQEFQKKIVSQQGQESDLTVNFRSHPGILEAVNSLFQPNMKEELFIQPPYAALLSMKEPVEGNPVEIVRVNQNGADKASAEDFRTGEAEAIADWIEKHVGQEFEGRLLTYHDCALLFRSANAFEETIEVFKRRGIPYLSEGEKFFYQTFEVTEFLNLLSAVANPDNKVALVGVLRSPIGGLTDEEILNLSRAKGLDYRTNPPLFADKIGGLYTTLRDLALEAKVQPVSRMVQKIFNQTWVLELTGATRYGEQAVANLFKIKSLAQKWPDNNPMTLEAFVKRFKSYREDEKEEGENPLADVRVDAVKIMTIHKAKGMEFPVVFLPNLLAQKKKFRPDASMVRDWQTRQVGLRLTKARKTNGLMFLLEEKIQKKEKAEELRVLYVAATRAKNKLIFLFRDPCAAYLEVRTLFSKAVGWPGLEASILKMGSWEVPIHSHLLSVSAVTSRPPAKKELAHTWDAKRLAERIAKRKAEAAHWADQVLMSSPTLEMRAFKSAQKKLLEIPSEYEKINLKDDDQPVMDDYATRLGVLCHEVLEQLDFKLPIKKQKAWIAELIRKKTILKDALALEAEKILNEFLNSEWIKKMAEITILGRETPFLYGSDTKIMRGVIDLIYKEGAQIVIADYKTNKISAKNLDAVIEPYRIQAQLYKEALQKSLGQEALFELVFLRTGQTIRL